MRNPFPRWRIIEALRLPAPREGMTSWLVVEAWQYTRRLGYFARWIASDGSHRWVVCPEMEAFGSLREAIRWKANRVES